MGAKSLLGGEDEVRHVCDRFSNVRHPALPSPGMESGEQDPRLGFPPWPRESRLLGRFLEGLVEPLPELGLPVKMVPAFVPPPKCVWVASRGATDRTDKDCGAWKVLCDVQLAVPRAQGCTCPARTFGPHPDTEAVLSSVQASFLLALCLSVRKSFLEGASPIQNAPVGNALLWSPR